jgi:PAS domain S-box-containing protein
LKVVTDQADSDGARTSTGRAPPDRERALLELEAGVRAIGQRLTQLASGNLWMDRVPRSGGGDPLDALAAAFNDMAEEVGGTLAELDRQRTVLEATLESMVDGVLLLDATGSVRRCNAAVGHLVGRPPSEIVGHAFAALLDDREAGFAASLPGQVEQGPLRDRTVFFCGSDGKGIPISVNGSAHRLPDGPLLGIVLVLRDDRLLKAAQAQLQINDRMAAMGTVAAGVAHEINNPLSYVLSNLDFLQTELRRWRDQPIPPERYAEVLDAVDSTFEGAERVRHIVRDLKTFSRVDTEAIGKVDLNRLVDSSVGMLKNEVRHHAQLVKAYGAPPLVEANESRLGQVVMNLIQNAAQAIPPGRVQANQVRVSTGSTDAGEAFLEVQDSGSGIPPADLTRIFDAFFTTKPIGVGTGLGLSICHKVVTNLGGHIDVRTEVGRGSTFRVVLPPAREQILGPRNASPPMLTASRRLRILVMDDEAEVCMALQRLLGREHDVDAATDAAEFFAALGRVTYDALLCDLMMPETSGMELYARLLVERPELARRMVFMTAGAFHAEARTFLDRVSNPRLEKPLDHEKLRAYLLRVANGGTSPGSQ